MDNRVPVSDDDIADILHDVYVKADREMNDEENNLNMFQNQPRRQHEDARFPYHNHERNMRIIDEDDSLPNDAVRNDTESLQNDESSTGSRSHGASSHSLSRQLQQPEPKLPGNDATSDISSQTLRRKYAKCTVAALLTSLFFIIGIGLGLGYGVFFAQKKDPEPEATPTTDTNQNATNTTNNKNTTGVAWLDAKEYSLFGGLETAKTKEVTDRDACFDFCKDYDALQYLYVQDSCACFNNVTCLLPWGPQVDSSNFQFVGDLYTKNELESCSEDFCQTVKDESSLCFTGNSQDYQKYSLHGTNLQERFAKKVDTLDECLELCAPYEAASLLNWKDCTCYDNVECWMEWGNSVDTQLFFGTIYSKKPLDICVEEFCQVNQDARCFTANVQDSKNYAVYGTAMKVHNSTFASDETQCQELCAPYDAASFRRPNACTC